MLNRTQKTEQIEKSVKAIKASGGLLFADFSHLPVSDLKGLRMKLREAGAKFNVFKKRLLKIALKRSGVDYDPTQFDAQTGVLFVTDILGIAGEVYKFSKDMAKAKKNFMVLGGFDLKENKPMTAEEFMVLARLPSREILLAQIAIVFSMPMRQLAYALSEVAKSRNTK